VVSITTGLSPAAMSGFSPNFWDVLGYIQIGILGKVESVLFAHRRIFVQG
jgi:hypothetical protein